MSGACSNLSPFRDDIDFPTKDTVILDADEEDNKTVDSQRFSFRPGYKVPSSPEPSVAALPLSPRQNYFDGFDRSSLHLTLDTIPNPPLNKPHDTRVDLWAPAGKLGVAIDVVEGRPIVRRIKAGSPLEGFFLEKGPYRRNRHLSYIGNHIYSYRCSLQNYFSRKYESKMVHVYVYECGWLARIGKN